MAVSPKNFFAELKRRNVYEVAIAYGVVSWLLIQIATQVFPFLEIPNWAIRLVIMLIIIGFPIALVIASAFEATPEGIKRTEVADAAGQRSRGGAWIYVVLIGAALSVGLFFLGRYTASRKQTESAERGRIASNKRRAFVRASEERQTSVYRRLAETGACNLEIGLRPDLLKLCLRDFCFLLVFLLRRQTFRESQQRPAVSWQTREIVAIDLFGFGKTLLLH
jgi:hypothetical protein